MLDIFTGDDFSLISMTEAINELPVVQSRFGAKGIFTGGGISTLTVGIESIDGELRLIPTQPRGTMPEYKTTPRRKLRAIQVPHIPKNDTIIADSVQGVRAFGSEDTTEAVTQVVNDRLALLKAEHELTWEWHRIGALQGNIVDADGTSSILNLFTEYGVSRITLNWDTTDATGLRQLCIALKRNIESELKMVPYTSIEVQCSEGFWDKLMTSSETMDAFSYYQENSFGREGTPALFNYCGVEFEELRGQFGSVPLVPDDEAFAYPRTSANLFRQFFAPEHFMETVNTIGLPYYAKQELLKFGKGVEIHTQSNPLFICTKPRVLVKLTYSE